ncbi:tail virion protein G7P-2 [Salinicola acroporae]
MTAEQFDQLCLLIFCIGLVACFGLGAIKGGQR